MLTQKLDVQQGQNGMIASNDDLCHFSNATHSAKGQETDFAVQYGVRTWHRTILFGQTGMSEVAETPLVRDPHRQKKGL